MNGSKECSLLHTKTSDPGPCGSGSPFTVTTGTGFGTSVTSFSSTLSGPAQKGTLVECFGPDLWRNAGNMVGNSTLQILGQYHSMTLWYVCLPLYYYMFLLTTINTSINVEHCGVNLSKQGRPASFG